MNAGDCRRSAPPCRRSGRQGRTSHVRGHHHGPRHLADVPSERGWCAGASVGGQGHGRGNAERQRRRRRRGRQRKRIPTSALPTVRRPCMLAAPDCWASMPMQQPCRIAAARGRRQRRRRAGQLGAAGPSHPLSHGSLACPRTRGTPGQRARPLHKAPSRSASAPSPLHLLALEIAPHGGGFCCSRPPGLPTARVRSALSNPRSPRSPPCASPIKGVRHCRGAMWAAIAARGRPHAE